MSRPFSVREGPDRRDSPARGRAAVHLIGFPYHVAVRATLREPGLVRSLTIVEPNLPWLLEGDSESETVLAWWRDQNERVRAEAAGDAEHGAKLWFELVDNRGPDTRYPTCPTKPS